LTPAVCLPLVLRAARKDRPQKITLNQPASSFCTREGERSLFSALEFGIPCLSIASCKKPSPKLAAVPLSLPRTDQKKHKYHRQYLKRNFTTRLSILCAQAPPALRLIPPCWIVGFIKILDLFPARCILIKVLRKTAKGIPIGNVATCVVFRFDYNFCYASSATHLQNPPLSLQQRILFSQKTAGNLLTYPPPFNISAPGIECLSLKNFFPSKLAHTKKDRT